MLHFERTNRSAQIDKKGTQGLETTHLPLPGDGLSQNRVGNLRQQHLGTAPKEIESLSPDVYTELLVKRKETSMAELLDMSAYSF
jgi:hypothetical protein